MGSGISPDLTGHGGATSGHQTREMELELGSKGDPFDDIISATSKYGSYL